MKVLFLKTLALGLLVFPTGVFAPTVTPPPAINDSNNDTLAIVVGLAIVGFALFGNGIGAARGKSEKRQLRVGQSGDKKVIEKF